MWDAFNPVHWLRFCGVCQGEMDLQLIFYRSITSNLRLPLGCVIQLENSSGASAEVFQGREPIHEVVLVSKI